MATPVAAISTTALLIAISNGDSPETFTHPCMINTNRGIQFSSSPIETLLPFCDLPDLPGFVDREIDSLTAQITGAGVLDVTKTGIELFWDWYLDGLSKHLHVIIGDLGFWDGHFVCSAFSAVGPARRQKANFDCTLLSDGPIAWQIST